MASLQARESSHLEKIASFKDELALRAESLRRQDIREAELKASITKSEKRTDTAERSLAQANQAMEALRTELDQMSTKAEKATLSDAVHERIVTLEARLEEQQSAVAVWVERSNSIAARYSEGKLVCCPRCLCFII